MRFNMEDGFPLLTTKKLHVPSILHELLWFIQGTESVKYLRDNKVKIWEEWTKEDGTVGPLYGVQWRNWNGIDQLQNAIDEIKNNPSSRRILVSAWNVSQLEDMVLNPCHILFQFYVSGKNNEKLSLQVYQRSCDFFLGVCYNIASYSFLLYMVGLITNKQPHEVVWVGGDVHLYNNHFVQAATQLNRVPYKLPELNIIRNNVENINDFKFEDFEISNYVAHPHIKAEVSV